jgi:hypothetical protein
VSAQNIKPTPGIQVSTKQSLHSKNKGIDMIIEVENYFSLSVLASVLSSALSSVLAAALYLSFKAFTISL